jgi:hypothetical protein
MISWKKQIRDVTQMDWDITSGHTMDEVSFWNEMQTRLKEIRAQLSSPGACARVRQPARPRAAPRRSD